MLKEEFLSQEEIDALLKGVSDDADDDPVEAADPSGIRSYNLGSQERIVRGRMPTLEIINERFARNWRIGLFNFMRRNAEISVGPVADRLDHGVGHADVQRPDRASPPRGWRRRIRPRQR